MLENGGALGLLLGLIFCGVLTVLLVWENKKIKAELDEVMAKISKEDIEKIKNSGFKEYPENNKFFIGTSIVTGTEEKGDKVKIKLLFYNGFWTQYVIYAISMSKDKYVQKNIHEGDFVRTLHENEKEGRLKIKEIV